MQVKCPQFSLLCGYLGLLAIYGRITFLRSLSLPHTPKKTFSKIILTYHPICTVLPVHLGIRWKQRDPWHFEITEVAWLASHNAI